MHHSILRLLCVTGLALLLSQCASSKEEAPVAPHGARLAFWKEDGTITTSPRLVIDLSEQSVGFYRGESLLGLSPISSGRAGHGTPTGKFRVTEKNVHHRSSIYGDYVDADGNVVEGDVDNRTDPRPPGTRYLGADMQHFMRINGPIGMHRGYLPGYPASHGCIRLPGKMAAKFFEATPHGTPVHVVGSANNYPGHPTVVMPESLTPAEGKDAKTKAKKQSPSKKSKHPKQPQAPRGTTYYL